MSSNIYAQKSFWASVIDFYTRFAAFQALLATVVAGGQQQLIVEGQEVDESLVLLHRHLGHPGYTHTHTHQSRRESLQTSDVTHFTVLVDIL